VVLLVAGMPGSGKSVVCSVAKSMGLPVYVLGDIVREEVAKRGLEPTLENLLRVAEELRIQRGKGAVAELLVEKMLHQCIESCVVVVDGVRSLEEVKVFREKLGVEVLIVAVHASPRTRFERLKQRARPGDPRSWEEFVERDLKELRWGLGDVIALADYMIVNERSLDELIGNVRDLLSKVISEWCT